MSNEVRTRFAPSPTGVLHIGSVRTALFCWLYARHHQGRFILRIEDTDRERSSKENVDAILDGLSWLGLNFDESPFYQTERFDRYSTVIEEWLDSGLAYRCYCTRDELEALRTRQKEAGEHVRYDGRCRHRSAPRDGISPVVRFKNPVAGEVVVDDRVRGRVVFQNEQLDDLIIARSDGTPTYNFTVVVDDSEMQITHVIRGDDHLNNTPRQMNMMRALGVQPPSYAHLPMILGPDGSKLSKRHGAVDIREYRHEGYLPDAVLNYLVRLGWSYGDKEVFSVGEMIELFDIADVNQSASTFNPEKLRWVNQQHILAMAPAKLAELLVPFLNDVGFDIESGPTPSAVAEGFHERAETLRQMAESADYCYRDFAAVEPKLARKFLRPVILEGISDVHRRLSDLPAWDKQLISDQIQDAAHACGLPFGKLGQPLRVAVTGAAASPPIDVTLFLVGRDRTLRRLEDAISFIRKRAAEAAN